MFLSLVYQGVEPTNIKMAGLRQSLTGTALVAIRGLGVSEPEYKEAKEILQSNAVFTLGIFTVVKEFTYLGKFLVNVNIN